MLKVFVKYSVDVGLAGFLKPVAFAVDVVPVDASMHVSLVADVIHVASPVLVMLAASAEGARLRRESAPRIDVIHTASPMLVLLPFDDVLFVILIIPMHLEVLQLRQIPFFFLLAEYLLLLQHVAKFVL